MPITVTVTDDPARVLAEAGAFLASEPVLHNVVLTLLHARVAHPEPGRSWVARDGGSAVGVVFQSPLTFPAVMTPMAGDVVAAVVDAMTDAGAEIPGINAEAATAARFAGRWTERHDSAAVPSKGLRHYEAREVHDRGAAAGELRPAGGDDRELLVAWVGAFHADTNEPAGDVGLSVDRRLEAGQLWLWEDGEPVSLAGVTEPVEGVVRVPLAYTPPERRGRGYIQACVGALTQRVLGEGYRCTLYADLGNPASNAAFRRVGYRAVGEVLRYRLEPGRRY